MSRVTGLSVGNSPGPVNSRHEGPVTRKMLPFDDVIMRLWWHRRLSCTTIPGAASDGKVGIMTILTFQLTCNVISILRDRLFSLIIVWGTAMSRSHTAAVTDIQTLLRNLWAFLIKHSVSDYELSMEIVAALFAFLLESQMVYIEVVNVLLSSSLLHKGSIPSTVWVFSWWRHQMETFSALLMLCAGNSPVTGEFPAQWPVTRSFDAFFDLCLE